MIVYNFEKNKLSGKSFDKDIFFKYINNNNNIITSDKNLIFVNTLKLLE